MNINHNNKYDKKIIDLIKDSGFRTCRSGIHEIFISQATRSNERAIIANKSKLIEIEQGETASTILSCAVACESAISEFIEHYTFANGGLTSELIEIRNEKSTLKQWKLFLKYRKSDLDLSTNKKYNNLGCLLKVRDAIAHRNARLLKVGNFPPRISPCITYKTIPVNFENKLDWIDSILTCTVSTWALRTTNEWFSLINKYIQLEC